MSKNLSRILFFSAFLLLLVYGVLTFMNLHSYAGLILVITFVMMAIAFRGYELLKGYSYTLTILAAVSLAMYYPHYFITVGSYDLKGLITPLLQIIMFGMGTSLSVQDFYGVIKMPKGVLIGVVCQFTIMPFVGFGVASLFSFPTEIAAGIILIGSCPSGLASNVMSYLAKANLALSVTLTTVATLMSPFITPFYMKFLGGEFIAVDYMQMMWDITKVVIIPIAVGLIFHHLFQSRFKILEKIMPLFSMGGIALILVIIISRGRDNLIEVGLLLVLAVFIHNMLGYFLGYSAGRLLRMPEQDCRTIALEVGMQNGGLASSIAADTLGKAGTVGLAPAIFGSMMNITGSSLALWWRSKSPKEE